VIKKKIKISIRMLEAAVLEASCYAAA